VGIVLGYPFLSEMLKVKTYITINYFKEVRLPGNMKKYFFHQNISPDLFLIFP